MSVRLRILNLIYGSNGRLLMCRSRRRMGLFIDIGELLRLLVDRMVRFRRLVRLFYGGLMRIVNVILIVRCSLDLKLLVLYRILILFENYGIVLNLGVILNLKLLRNRLL